MGLHGRVGGGLRVLHDFFQVDRALFIFAVLKGFIGGLGSVLGIFHGKLCFLAASRGIGATLEILLRECRYSEGESKNGRDETTGHGFLDWGSKAIRR